MLYITLFGPVDDLESTIIVKRSLALNVGGPCGTHSICREMVLETDTFNVFIVKARFLLSLGYL